MANKLVGVYLDTEIVKQAKIKCLNEGTNFSRFINELLKSNLNKENKKNV